jgi:hypothetical protein
MTIFEGVGNSEQTQNELKLLLTDSVFSSDSNSVSDTKNLDMSKFEVLSTPLPFFKGNLLAYKRKNVIQILLFSLLSSETMLR